MLGVGVRAGEEHQLDMLPMYPSGDWGGERKEGGGITGCNIGKSDLEHGGRLR